MSRAGEVAMFEISRLIVNGWRVVGSGGRMEVMGGEGDGGVARVSLKDGFSRFALFGRYELNKEIAMSCSVSSATYAQPAAQPTVQKSTASSTPKPQPAEAPIDSVQLSAEAQSASK
jgi:hypothetical protein